METSLVGSYPQPAWLVDREKLRGRLPPRVRASDIWKIDPDQLADAQDAATLAAIRDQERAGLDIVTDGEIRRESYSNYFVLALDGIDVDTPGEALDRNGNPMPVPRVAGPITRRGGSILKRDAEFLRGATDRKIKVTVPGPFTMAQQAQNDHYGSEEEVAFAFADVVRAEVTELFEAGVDIVQLDEPWMESRSEQARAYGIETLNRALDGVTGTTVLHICFGYPLFVPGHKRTYRFLRRAGRSAGGPDLDRDGAGRAGSRGPGAARRQDDRARRDRAGLRRGRVGGDRQGADRARAAVHPQPRRGARLRHEVSES